MKTPNPGSNDALAVSRGTVPRWTQPATTTLRMIDSKVIDAGKLDPIEQGRLRAENFLTGLEPGSPTWCMIDALRMDFVEATRERTREET